MSTFDQLNLRPQEKRILVVVGFLIFVVLNWMFVKPLFGQLGAAQEELAKARKTQERYQAEIAKTPTYKAAEESLKTRGSEILNEPLQLQKIIEQYIVSSGLEVSRRTAVAPSSRGLLGKTNQFFEDQGFSIDFNSYSTNLIEFLVGLASGNNMIRVLDMNLKPDGTGTRLLGTIVFVASYQSKAPTRSAAAMAKPSGGAASQPATGGAAPAEKPKAFAAPKTKTIDAPPPVTTRPTNSPATKPLTNAPKAMKK
jgi:hypothetical protein